MITGPRDTLKKARKLRSEMSLPETLLWRELRKRPGGFKVRRQHPAGHYVLDFYCAAARLAIEVDGWAHASADAARRDAERSRHLRSQGVATTPVPAKVIMEDAGSAAARLAQICEERIHALAGAGDVPLHHPRNKSGAGPPPRPGEVS